MKKEYERNENILPNSIQICCHFWFNLFAQTNYPKYSCYEILFFFSFYCVWIPYKKYDNVDIIKESTGIKWLGIFVTIGNWLICVDSWTICIIIINLTKSIIIFLISYTNWWILAFQMFNYLVLSKKISGNKCEIWQIPSWFFYFIDP